MAIMARPWLCLCLTLIWAASATTLDTWRLVKDLADIHEQEIDHVVVFLDPERSDESVILANFSVPVELRFGADNNRSFESRSLVFFDRFVSVPSGIEFPHDVIFYLPKAQTQKLSALQRPQTHPSHFTARFSPTKTILIHPLTLDESGLFS